MQQYLVPGNNTMLIAIIATHTISGIVDWRLLVITNLRYFINYPGLKVDILHAEISRNASTNAFHSLQVLWS